MTPEQQLDEIDIKQIDESARQCRIRWGGRSPCLKKIVVSPDHSYKVTCGAPHGYGAAKSYGPDIQPK